MKSKCVFAGVVIILLCITCCSAQNENYFSIPSRYLTITCNKTTNLIFPYSVQSIDRGSQDILAQQPKGTQNIVQIKAGKPNFTQSNLSVITTDGQLYSFIVDYKSEPSQLNLIIREDYASSNDLAVKQVMKLTGANNQALFQAVAQKILSLKVKHIKRNSDNQMMFRLNGIYVNHDMIYFRVQLKNNSNISYDVGNIRFSIKDAQKSKRTATQETEVGQAYKYGDFQHVEPDSAVAGVIALPKFTLPESKYLSIQILEKDGSRNLSLILKNRQFMKVAAVNEMK